MEDENILIWLPSPMGDAVLCTPALRAIRQRFNSAKICFFANAVVHEVLSPCRFNNTWLPQQTNNPFTVAKMFKEHNFTHAILLKNSFSSALAVFLAQIPSRIGYARQGRGFFLTEQLLAPKLPNGKFKPAPMVDYYLAIASWLGAETMDRSLELITDPDQASTLSKKLPRIFNPGGPVVVLVPGGAYGPSKYWLPERFAETADWLIDNYKATVVVSVSDNPTEKQIAEHICNLSRHELVNLGQNPVSLGQLKSLFSVADLVVTNDTGPRHIAIALQRKVISLFGPNNPLWTDTGYEDEIKIVGQAPCVPCTKPTCKEKEHLCMQAITVEVVCDASKKLLQASQGKQPVCKDQQYIEVSKSFFVDAAYKAAFSELELNSADDVFSFSAGTNLVKNNLAGYRTRTQFDINSPATTLFLKRYVTPPVLSQLKNWLTHRKRISFGYCDFQHTDKLTSFGINTPKTISYGQQWGLLFEKRSFAVTQKIPNAESLERKLPDYFNSPATPENLKLRRHFVIKLAAFIKKFHEAGYCHRDLYLAHIFLDENSQFYLIDLARCFKPVLLGNRFRIKDIAQLYYSAPRSFFSGTDRIRFYLALVGKRKLTEKDKTFIRKVEGKAKRMARHDTKHGRAVPFLA